MKNQSSIAIAKVAAALLDDLARHNFTPSLTYRTRAHNLNCFKAEDVKAAFKLTLAAHPDVDVSELRLRVMAIGKVRSKDAMNWQIDDLINFLQGWVEAGRLTEEREAEEQAKAAPAQMVYFRGTNNTSRIRRYSPDWPATANCQRLVDGVWTACAITVADAIGLLETPEFLECGPEGHPLRQLAMTKPEPIPAKLNTKAMMEADAMKAVEGFGLNPKTVVETMTRVAGAMRRDGLTQDQITADVLAAYMEADRKTQEKMFMDYMTNPETRKRVQGAVLDILKERDTAEQVEAETLKKALTDTSNRFMNEWVIWSDREQTAYQINRRGNPESASPMLATEQGLVLGKAVAEMMGCRLVRRHRAISMRLAHLTK